jgi:hypothetical protein
MFLDCWGHQDRPFEEMPVRQCQVVGTHSSQRVPQAKHRQLGVDFLDHVGELQAVTFVLDEILDVSSCSF